MKVSCHKEKENCNKEKVNLRSITLTKSREPWKFYLYPQKGMRAFSLKILWKEKKEEDDKGRTGQGLIINCSLLASTWNNEWWWSQQDNLRLWTLLAIDWSTIMMMLMVKSRYSFGNVSLATNSENCYQASKADQSKASRICLKTVTERKKTDSKCKKQAQKYIL